MAKKLYGQVNVRFALDEPEEKKLFEIIDDLDLGVHKSKNKFILDAIKAYVNNYGEEYLCESARKENYVTREVFEAKIAEIKYEVSKEVYQEIIKFVATSGLTNMIISPQEKVTNERKVESITSNVAGSPTEEMMEDIMKWS